MTSKEDKRRNIKKVLVDAGIVSNVHGISRIITAKSTKLKVFWLIFVLSAFVGAVYHLSLMIKAYFLYPVAEISSSKEGIPIEFPSVTVCNTSPISLKKVSDVVTSPKGENLFKWFTFVSEFSEVDKVRSSLDSMELFFENFPQEATQSAHNIEDFVLYCKFDNVVCGPENFSTFFDSANYFNCFTFNNGYNKETKSLADKKLVARDNGVVNGLSLILSLNNEKPPHGAYGIYDKGKIQQFSAGARVQIHAPGTMPSPANQGFDVAPGFSTTVGVQAVLHSRLNQPYGNCTSKHLQGGREYRNTMSTCLQICKQTILVNRCGCKKSDITMLYEGDILDDKVPFCGVINEYQNWSYISKKEKDAYLEKLECQNNVFKDFDKNGIDDKLCGCFQPCEELTYRTSLSMSHWPLEFYHYGLLQSLNIDGRLQEQLKEAHDILRAYIKRADESMINGTEFEFTQTDLNNKMLASSIVRENLIRLNIFVDSLSITEFKKVPTYGIFDLLADIGGTLGLWLGVSVLTMMELIELKMKIA